LDRFLTLNLIETAPKEMGIYYQRKPAGSDEKNKGKDS
jgi:hypothetical protein